MKKSTKKHKGRQLKQSLTVEIRGKSHHHLGKESAKKGNDFVIGEGKSRFRDDHLPTEKKNLGNWKSHLLTKKKRRH